MVLLPFLPELAASRRPAAQQISVPIARCDAETPGFQITQVYSSDGGSTKIKTLTLSLNADGDSVGRSVHIISARNSCADVHQGRAQREKAFVDRESETRPLCRPSSTRARETLDHEIERRGTPIDQLRAQSKKSAEDALELPYRTSAALVRRSKELARSDEGCNSANAKTREL